MEIVKIAGIGLVGAVLAILLKKQTPEISLQLSLATGLVITLLVAERLVESVTVLRAFAEQYAQVYAAVGLMLKIVGIAYVSESTAELLRDAGQSVVGAKVEFAGRVVIVSLSLPLLSEQYDMLGSEIRVVPR